MTRRMVNTCDNPDCAVQADQISPGRLPHGWISTTVVDDFYKTYGREYELCSVACYEAVVPDKYKTKSAVVNVTADALTDEQVETLANKIMRVMRRRQARNGG